MTKTHKPTCASVEVKDEARRKQDRAKRGLGLNRMQMLPRCAHKLQAKVKRFEAAGDFSHSDKKHWCQECTCKNTAGSGTDHFGVGWCQPHEKCHCDKDCKQRVDLMTQAIRAGAPNSVWEFQSTSKYFAKIQKEANNSQGLIGMREQQVVVIDLVQQLLDCSNGGTKTNGKPFTESSKDGPVRASDATMFKLMNQCAATLARLAQVELVIKDEDFTHWDECQVFVLSIVKIVESLMEKEDFGKFMKELSSVPQPRRGRKRNK